MTVLLAAKLKLHKTLRVARLIKPPDKVYEYAFEVDTATFYPAAVNDIIYTIETNQGWTEVEALNRQVISIDQCAWDLVEVPASRARDEDAELRRQALELARLWFTEKLHALVGHGKMFLRITKNQAYKLYP